MRRRIGTSLLMVVLFGSTWAQLDTTRIVFGDKEAVVGDDAPNRFDDYKKKKKKYSYFPLSAMAHWAGIEFGINGYHGSNTSMDLPTDANALDLNYGKSWFVNVNILEGRADLYEHWLGLVTGLGFNMNRYDLKRQTVFNYSPDSTWTYVDTVHHFQKNKLKATYLTIPLMLEVNTNEKASKSFHFAAGVIAGIRIASRTRTVYEEDGVKNVITRKSNYNLNSWRGTATARAGYGPITVLFNYTFTRLFEKKLGPTLYPFEIGLALNFR